MKKLIIIPAFNEEDSIKNTVCMIRKKAPDFDYVVINDHSSDHTLQVLEENHFSYVSLPSNLGIGGAVQTGYRYALAHDYDVAVQIDADGQHDPAYLHEMLMVMEQEHADLVIGSRFIDRKGFQSTLARRMGIAWFTGLIHHLTGHVITDPTSGYRMADKEVIRLFAQDYPRDYPEPESTVSLLKRGKKVVEVPVEMKARQGGTSSIHISNSIYYMIKVTLAILIENIRKYQEKEHYEH